MANEKKWTILVWMAGDNDLEKFGKGDLGELKRIGSTDHVNVLVQLDTMSDSRTRRYHVHAKTTVDEDVVADLGETNTGDPRVAIDFFTWGITQYPADHYLAVLWNHGSGIDEEDLYARAAKRGVTVERRVGRTATTLPRSRVRAVTSRRYRRALFSTTIEAAIASRAIAYDDTSRDFLDNLELKNVLRTVKKNTQRTIDLVGFDACLMNMIEVAYQLRSTADFIVGSEELEPGDGWPYDAVLAALVANPAMTPKQLGTAIVQRYVKSYTADDVTLSLLDLKRAEAAAKAVDVLAGSLIKAIKDPVEYAAVTKAILSAQHYDTKDFIDLHDLSDQLKTRCKSKGVREAAQKTIQALEGDQFVVAEKHKGSSVKKSHGVAIYVARGDATVAYDKLDFAKATRWGEFIRKYTGR